MIVCLQVGAVMARNILFFLPYSFKLNEFISMNFPALSLLDMRKFYMNHTRFNSLVSAIQFTIEKSKFKSDSLLIAQVGAIIAVTLCFSCRTT